jgi:hypothetical protein
MVSQSDPPPVTSLATAIGPIWLQQSDRSGYSRSLWGWSLRSDWAHKVKGLERPAPGKIVSEARHIKRSAIEGWTRISNRLKEPFANRLA